MRTFTRSYKSLSATLDLKAIRAIQSNLKTIKKKAEPPQWTFYLHHTRSLPNGSDFLRGWSKNNSDLIMRKSKQT